MKSIETIMEIINSYHELGETIAAANFLIEEYGIKHPNLEGFELSEKAKPEFVLMTTEGTFGKKQIIKIPENTFEFPLVLMLNLIAHEMIHVEQKVEKDLFLDRNEREWQAYYEMLFHNTYPQVPKLSNSYQKSFANKAIEYYTKMGENSDLQKKYSAQKTEVDNLIVSLG
jgi:hypothetical protein